MGERRERIVERLVGDAPELAANRLCEVCAEVAGVSVAGIVLMSEDVPRGSLCTNGDVGTVIDHLHTRRGGPVGGCLPIRPARIRARPGRTQHTPGSLSQDRQWRPGCVPPSASLSEWGRSGSGRSTCTPTGPGRSPKNSEPTQSSWPTSPQRRSCSWRWNAPTTKLASEFADGADFQNVVNQASGMIAAQLDISVGQALIRLRMYAFGDDRRVGDVARDVVARKLRVETHSNEDDTRLNNVSRDVPAAGIRHVAATQDASHNGDQGIP